MTDPDKRTGKLASRGNDLHVCGGQGRVIAASNTMPSLLGNRLLQKTG
jgi:hypothetical protein